MIGLRELWRRKLTFGPIAAVVALISYLVLVINGLGLGFRDEFGSALASFDASAIAFGDNAQGSVSRSLLDERALAAVESVPGVTASAAVGYLRADYRDGEGGVQSASLFGYDPGTIAEPAVVQGRPLSRTDDRGLLVDTAFLADAGFEIGDSVTILHELREEDFTIVGTVREGSFEWLPAVYLLRPSWQELRFGATTAEAPPAASIGLLQGDGLDGRTGPGFETVSTSSAFSSIEGLSDAEAMIWVLRLFGYAIGAAVIGVFFYVLTLHRVPGIGLLKALGASSWFVATQTLAQALAITVGGFALSVPAALLTESLLGGEGIPLVLTPGTYVATSISLAVTAVLAVAFSVRRIARVDPIIALAQQQ
jgi:putative ABC transport system permease protein